MQDRHATSATPRVRNWRTWHPLGRSIALLLLVKLVALIALKFTFFASAHDVDVDRTGAQLLSQHHQAKSAPTARSRNASRGLS